MGMGMGMGKEKGTRMERVKADSNDAGPSGKLGQQPLLGLRTGPGWP